MKRRRTIILSLGGLALAVIALLLSQQPVQDAILERWHLHQLGSSDYLAQRHAADRLAAMRSPRAIPILVALGWEQLARERFSLEDEGLPPWIPQTLVRIGPEGATAAFESLRDSAGDIPEYIFWALVELGPEALPALEIAAGDGSPTTQLHAAMALAQLDSLDEAAIRILFRLLLDEDPGVRKEAAWATAWIDPEGETVLTELAFMVRNLSSKIELRLRQPDVPP